MRRMAAIIRRYNTAVIDAKQETVTPLTVALPLPLAVTVKRFSASSASFTVATTELADELPSWRATPSVEIVGGVFGSAGIEQDRHVVRKIVRCAEILFAIAVKVTHRYGTRIPP